MWRARSKTNKEMIEQRVFGFYNTNRGYFEKANEDLGLPLRHRKLAESVHGIFLDVAGGKGGIDTFIRQKRDVEKIMACDLRRFLPCL